MPLKGRAGFARAAVLTRRLGPSAETKHYTEVDSPSSTLWGNATINTSEGAFLST
jgi:hypothetical protein